MKVLHLLAGNYIEGLTRIYLSLTNLKFESVGGTQRTYNYRTPPPEGGGYL